jgi:predicted transcriptional regulator/transcriptional regulator with XRE-family HTH domain
MEKTFVGSRLRRLRRDHNQTQAEMAAAIGVSTAYVNLLENNQRSLSVKVLMAISDAYGVDWRDLIEDDGARLLADLRTAVQDPVFDADRPDLQELRAAIDHAPMFVETFLTLYRNHAATIERMMRLGHERMPDDVLASSPESIVHDFFRKNANYFPLLEARAEALRTEEPCDTDDVYARLKARLSRKHGIAVQIAPVERMDRALRIHDRERGVIQLSEALDHQNRTFQLAHVLCFVEMEDDLRALTDAGGIRSQVGATRCQVELANYFAAAFLMPYAPFHGAAETLAYDADRLAAAFGVSFEQVCHRLTTLQRDGARGVPFFFLRVDKAGNVTKRFTATTLSIAEYGGSCPVWTIHTAFTTPGTIIPQFVELPDGQRFFTISRTIERPAFSRDSQARRMALSLGCEIQHAPRLAYAQTFNMADESLFSPIGINCHICPRQACSQRAHQPMFVELSIDPSRRGDTRLES